MTPTANRCFPTSIPALAFDFCADHHRLPSVAGKAVDVSELKFFHGSPTPIGGATRPLGHFVSGTKRAPFQFPAILPIAPSIPRKRAAYVAPIFSFPGVAGFAGHVDSFWHLGSTLRCGPDLCRHGLRSQMSMSLKTHDQFGFKWHRAADREVAAGLCRKCSARAPAL